jgi:hypothetical protein
MITGSQNKLTLIWLFVCGLTIASYLGATKLEGVSYTISTPITAGVLLAALIKSRLVMQHFMEVRGAPSWLRWTCDGWLVLLFGMIPVVGRIAT